MGQEIERRFILAAAPSPQFLAGSSGILIRQGYVLVEKGRELRVRDKGGRFVITRKSGQGLVREEAEELISESLFALIWPLTEGRRIEKRRYAVAYEGAKLEIDEYFGALAGFWSLEVEFPDTESAARFVPPDIVGPEVTDDPRLNNAQLALNGLPQEYRRT